MELFFGEDGERLRAPWRLLCQYLAYKAMVPLFTDVLVVAYLGILGGRGVVSPGVADASLLPGFPTLALIGGVAALIATLLSVWLAGRFLDRRPFADLGFHLGRSGWWLDLLFGLALGALLMTFVFLVELGLGWITVTGAWETVQPGAPFALAILPPIGLLLCVGVYEETLSRGYQLRNAAEGLNYPALGPRGAIVLAWVLSSIFFGALHIDNPNATFLSTANIAVAGLMLGLGYVLTGELAIPIGLHITWNLFQANVYGFPVSGLKPLGATFLEIEQRGPEIWTGGPFGPEAGLIGVSAMILGGLLITLWVRLRNGKIAIHTLLAEEPKPGRPAGDPSQPTE
ncbi:MAG: CPBP family intramembrane metalloprotease [Actinomycetota bacterium]|nr:CPBP family intramembrane metalloprotease [Actinomycetota bacterium]